MKIKEIGDFIPKTNKAIKHCFEGINIYPCSLNVGFILLLSYFYPNFILNLSYFYPFFILIFTLQTNNYKLMTGGLACPHTEWVL